MLEIPEYQIAKLQLGSGDILVLKFHGVLTAHQADTIAAQAKQVGPKGMRFLILDKQADIMVLTSAEIESRAITI